MKPAATISPEAARFRWQLQVAIMLVAAAVIGVVLVDAERRAAADAETAARTEFGNWVTVLRQLHTLRDGALLERCRELVRKPRLHAALEDGALDLLYPSARDEMRDIMEDEEKDTGTEPAGYGLHAEFYRFLDLHGRVIPPRATDGVGDLTPAETAQLTLPQPPADAQRGCVVRDHIDADGPIYDIVAMPIWSSETAEVIATLVLGFESQGPLSIPPTAGILRGVWTAGRLFLGNLPAAERDGIARQLSRVDDGTGAPAHPLAVQVGGVPHLLFVQRLNPGSLYPPVHEVSLYSLAPLQQQRAQLRWRVLGTGGLVLLLGLFASRLVAGRFARPVQRLARDSAEQQARRREAEAALEQTNEELLRAARFSADASHQLKTPVTVLRAGLEELLAQENLTPAECNEIAGLIHQTYRLSGVIEDLLLLSRMDAGRLKIEFAPVDLTQLIEAALDDLGAQPEDDLAIETDFPPALRVAGEKRYLALILQNLLENARKYNRPGGRIRVAAREAGGEVTLTVGNTGRPIPAAARAHIFERFHRGAMGENVPGYGLGLNLARELARLHAGDLRLVGSDDDWTEFEVRFRAATAKSDEKSGRFDAGADTR
ncbi:MAG TPA: HAMP domain-containing sensor histidine kinase [Opitutus sp.]|nr:HAMP domain-containing sensor histidine kinase [Opitutus sp.]